MKGARLLYDEALGRAIERVAEPVRAFHRAASPAHFTGRASVERGTNPIAHFIADMMGLPAASPDCAIEFRLTRDIDGVETWRRTFAGASFTSTQEQGRGGWSGFIVERFGPMSFALAATEERGRLRVVPRHWSAFGIPMPAFLGPRADGIEHNANGRFNFDVVLCLPLLGLIVHYRGWLEPLGEAAML